MIVFFFRKNSEAFVPTSDYTINEQEFKNEFSNKLDNGVCLF